MMTIQPFHELEMAHVIFFYNMRQCYCAKSSNTLSVVSFSFSQAMIAVTLIHKNVVGLLEGLGFRLMVSWRCA